MKKLFFGDCLDVLKNLHAEHPEGFIDLIYIDPPFNSKRDYNVLFESIDLKDSTAQKQAFADTWSNVSYLDTLNEIQELDLDLFNFLKSLDSIRISKSAVAYLTTMAIRLHYMHRVLKETGSFYLHCDPTMSHYLKLVCDLIFGEKNYRSEITWERTLGTGSSKFRARKFPNNTDTLLFFTKSDEYSFNMIRRPLSDGALKRYDKVDSDGRRFFWADLKTYSEERLDRLLATGEARISANAKNPRYKKFLTEDGTPITNLWNDIHLISTSSPERLGYPTQKPEALLERIVNASSSEGDLVADFFCGCGTTIAVAEKLNRSWIGVDISHLAIRLIKKRLLDSYRGNRRKLKEIHHSVEMHGLPKDIGSAKELAKSTVEGRFGFQDWVIEVMLGGVSNEKKVADGGWDGYLTFGVSEKERDVVLIEVKSGNVNVKNLREFIQVVKSKKAAIGTFVCFEEHVTKPMLLEAKKEGYYNKDVWGDKYDRIQIVTVEELLDGEGVEFPQTTQGTFRTAPKKLTGKKNQAGLFDE